jgi:hypothetical protein
MATEPHGLEALIAEHGGRSYIRLNASRGYHFYDHDKIAANGVYPLPKAPGDDAFLVCDGKVERLEKITPPRRIITKYELRGDLRGASKAEVLGVAEWGALPDGDQGLYRPIHEDIPRQAEPIPFLIQSEAGEPSKLPQGVVSIDPKYFAKFPAYWHLGPVRATAKYVLWRTAQRLAEIIKTNPLITWSSGWGRDLDELLKSQHRDSFFIEFKSMIVNGTAVSAAGTKSMFTTDAKERSGGYVQTVQAVDGADLTDLEAKVAAYVEKLTEQARKWVSPDRCPCCQRRFAKTKARP